MSGGPPNDPGHAGGPSVGRTSLILVPIALASRGAAFLVPLAIAMWYGVGIITDAWYWALSFPTFALVLAGTSLGSAATPAMAAVRAQAPERVPTFIGSLLVWTSVVALLAGLAVCVPGPWLLRHLTDFPAETRALAAIFLWELLPFIVLTSAGMALRVACEVHGRFTGVALTPLVRAAAVIITTWFLLGPLGPHALPWGLAVGEIIQVVFWAWLLRQAKVRIKPGIRLDPELRSVARDLAPILGGEVLVALNIVVDKAFGAWLETGSVATLEYADRARVIPQTLLNSTLLMVAYAAWSNLRARGAIAEARRAVDQALRWTLALSAAPLAGMYIGRVVLISLLYERGAFLPENTAQTASVLGYYIPGILPSMLGALAMRAHVVERNLRLVFWLGVLSVLSNATFNLTLMGPMGLDGLALASTLNTFLISAIYLWYLRELMRLRDWRGPACIAVCAGAVALAVELAGATPTSFSDPVLWVAGAACFTILGVAWKTSAAPGRAQA